MTRLPRQNSLLGIVCVGLYSAFANNCWATPPDTIIVVQPTEVLQMIEREVSQFSASVSSPTLFSALNNCPGADPQTQPAIEGSPGEVIIQMGAAAENMLAATGQAVASVASNAVAGPYVPNFNGAKRDYVSGLNAVIKAYIVTEINDAKKFRLTPTGYRVLCATSLGTAALVEAGRFYGQELLKAHLINKQGWQNHERAAWAAFAVSQFFSYGTTVATTYAWGYALNPTFHRENNTRRRLMSEANDAWSAVEGLRSMLDYYWHMYNYQPRADLRSFIIWLQQTIPFYENLYNQRLAAFTEYDASPFSHGPNDAPAAGARRILDSYPATNTLGEQPNLQSMWAALYNSVYSQCRGSEWWGATIMVTCPDPNSGDGTLLYAWFNKDYRTANGMMLVHYFRQPRIGVGTYYSLQLDPAKIPPIN